MSGEYINQIVAEKLDKNNFHAWKFRMTNFLMGKGYWEYIEGEQESAPELPEENPTTVLLQKCVHTKIGRRVLEKSCIGFLLVSKTQ